MKNKGLLLLLASALVIITACSVFTSEPDSIMIRVQNRSNLTFDSVKVVFWNQPFNYGSLAPFETSDYQEPDKAYRYAYVRVVSNGQEYVWQPIDFVGETPLRNGRYTYILDIQSSGGPYSFTLDIKSD